MVSKANNPAAKLFFSFTLVGFSANLLRGNGGVQPFFFPSSLGFGGKRHRRFLPVFLGVGGGGKCYVKIAGANSHFFFWGEHIFAEGGQNGNICPGT